MRPTSVETFDAGSRLRAHRLFALRAALAVAPRYAELRRLPVRDVEAALDAPTIDCWAALVVGAVRRGEWPDSALAEAGLRHLTDGAGTAGEGGLRAAGGIPVLGDSVWTRKVLGEEFSFPIADPEPSAVAFDRAVATIAAVLPSRSERIRAGATAAIGLEGPPASVSGCSSEDWPGLVAFGIRCAPLLLAEEVLHEITHTAVAECLLGEAGRWLRRMPALFSPFTDSVRPAQRLAHGILAYREVLFLWRESDEHIAADPALVGASSADAARAMRDRRMVVIEERVQRAEAELFAHFSTEDADAWASLSGRVLGVPSKSAPPAPRPLVDLGALESAGLNAIEQAEVVLALDGQKSSRVGVLPSAAGALHRATGGGTVVFGTVALLPSPDPRLGGFSNETAEEVPLDDPRASRGSVYAYVARAPFAARRCFDLDQEEKAGSALGIPECCQAWFATNWERARTERGGDPAALLASAAARAGDRILRPSWHVNAFAMYFGGGLCWHFPCSFTCEATAARIDERARRLHAKAPGLAARLVAVQRRPLLWTERYGVAMLSEESSLVNARWLAEEVVSPDRLAEFRDADLERGDIQTELTDALGPWLLLRWLE